MSGKRTVEFSITCGGTLINRFTVLTAAHCILNQDSETIGNDTIIHLITPNEYYPTWESMFTVILGQHNLGSIEPSVTRSVAKIIKV